MIPGIDHRAVALRRGRNLRTGLQWSATLLILLLALEGCAKKQKPSPPTPIMGIAKPVAADVSDWDEVVGRFVSIDAVEVRPRVSGYVTRVAFRDGQRVTRGQLLFVIDPRPFAAAFDRARANTAKAAATLATAEVELSRARALFEAKAASQQDVQTRLVQAQQARADLGIARADQRQAALNLDFTRVRAAVSGIVSDRKANPGSLVTADQSVLTSIVTLDPAHFAFEAPESIYLAAAHGGSLLGARVAVRLQDENGYPHEGRVEFVDNQIGAGSGTVRGRAVLPNPGGLLRPGLYGQMRLDDAKPYRALLVPDAAVTADQDRQLVMIVDRFAKVRERAVTTGPLIGKLRVIRSGLKPDEDVIVEGGQKVKSDQVVGTHAVAIPQPKPGQGEDATEKYKTPDASAGIVVGG